MSPVDRGHMSSAFGSQPFRCDSYGLTFCHRPRYYWVSWELTPAEGVLLQDGATGEAGVISFEASLKAADYLLSGWEPPLQGFPTFTTPRPRDAPGRRPAGLEHCKPHERARWEAHHYRYPPYQYKDDKGATNSKGAWRLPTAEEKEALMHFPVHYTRTCMPKQQQQGQSFEDKRHFLLGNSWQVGVVCYLISQLGSILGLCQALSAQDIVRRTAPGGGEKLASLLLRPPLQGKKLLAQTDGATLSRKLMGLTSVKGEDIMLQASSEQLVRHHRLRSSVPASLWVWREVAGWSWRGTPEHINTLEMRAILTTLKWLTTKKKLKGVRFVHLTDSLVCLHALSRGRTSSRKLRRTLIRIQALLLRFDLHPRWTYVHTSLNPADRPSRRGFFIRKKWLKR